MDANAIKARFLRSVEKPVSLEVLRAQAQRCAAAGSKASTEDRVDIAAALAHVAFLAPDAIVAAYDTLAEGWQGRAVEATPVEPFDLPAEPAPEGLWEAYWSVVEDGHAGRLDALSITQRTAALGHFMPAETVDRISRSAHRFEGVSDAAAGPMPELITLETLAACPAGSLGRKFHDLIVDNKFDLEVLDRQEIGLNDLPQPLAYLNTRMLQAHDLWHITAGYQTTALHEIAISAFQMAQFGHNYSAQFLSITGILGAFAPGRAYRYLMDTITSAWVHGRQSPALILIPWEEVWDQPVDSIRETYGLTTYESPHRPDLIERSQALSTMLQSFRGTFDRWRLGVVRFLGGGRVTANKD